MVKSHLPAATVPADNDLRSKLWETGRWMHAVIGLGQRRPALHVFSIWGIPGAETNADKMACNEAFLRDVFEAAAELGDVPIVIAGDFNVCPDASA
eukprot:11740044-Karenia_brevis.AAC.1